MIELEVTPEATSDLDGILHYSIVTFGEPAAARYFDLIERTILRLREFPFSGASYPGISPPVRYASVGSHRIFYTQTDARLTIWRVLHQSMRPHGRIKR